MATRKIRSSNARFVYLTKNKSLTISCFYPFNQFLDRSTSFGLIERRNQKLALEKDKYLSQLPNVSEYKERFQAYSANSYIQAKTTGVPKDISTSLYVLNNTLNNTPKPRTTGSSMRLPQTRDLLDIVYSNMYQKPKGLPRTLYYLGKVPTDGSTGVYRVRDFETLMPPADYDENAKESLKFIKNNVPAATELKEGANAQTSEGTA